MSEYTRPEGARSDTVRSISEADNAAGVCPFCRIVRGEERRDVLYESPYWLVVPNLSPLPGSDRMLLVISKIHALDLSELPLAAGSSLLEAVIEASAELGINSFVLLARLGRPDFNAMTVYHMHFQINSSNRLPATLDMVPEAHRNLIEELMERLPPHPRGPLEALGDLMGDIDLFRAAMEGKAIPLRYKGSNKVDPDRF